MAHTMPETILFFTTKDPGSKKKKEKRASMVVQW